MLFINEKMFCLAVCFFLHDERGKDGKNAKNAKINKYRHKIDINDAKYILYKLGAHHIDCVLKIN